MNKNTIVIITVTVVVTLLIFFIVIGLHEYNNRQTFSKIRSQESRLGSSSGEYSNNQPSDDYSNKLYVSIVPNFSGDWVTFKGSITNIGTRRVSFVKLKVNSIRNGSIKDSTSVYAVDDVSLSPGERRTWEAMLNVPNAYYYLEQGQQNFKVEIISYNLD